MEVTSTISSGNQITLPSAIRKVLGLAAGDKVVFTVQEDSVTVSRGKTQKELVEEMLQAFDKVNREHEQRMTPEQKKFAKMSAGWTINQYHEYFDNLPETKAYMKEKYGI